VNIRGPQPPEDRDTRYSYQYDSFGNWTEKVVTGVFGARSWTLTTRRTITYYA